MVDSSSCTTYLLPSTTISITTTISFITTGRVLIDLLSLLNCHDLLDTTAVAGNLTSLGSSSFIASSKPSITPSSNYKYIHWQLIIIIIQ